MSAESRCVGLTRRQAVVGALVSSAVLFPRWARARSRVVPGGRVAMRLPWPLGAIDPHRLDSAGALFFGACLWDALYALDPSGAPVPALAESLPEATAQGTRVVLRQGVRFASGKPLTPEDVRQSIARARALGSAGWLDPVGTVRVAADRSLLLGGRSADRVARALASPLTAIVPERFVPERPDGTGPFAAEPRADPGERLVLVQNRFAAEGPSFLDRLEIEPAPDLAASLRAFESGEDDIGWLGLGLHDPRRGAVAFDAGTMSWAVLRVGAQAGRWSLPGVAQRLADGIEPSRLAHLGVSSDAATEPDDGWGGTPCSLLVRGDSPWLVELARAVASALSRPDHEVTPSPVPVVDFEAARMAGSYVLAIDLVRPYDPTPLGAYVALACGDDPVRGAELARHPPLGAGASPRAIGRFLRLGVLADVRFKGGRMPDLVLPALPSGAGVDFASITGPAPRVR